ncbi:bifunctional precorrin-2 dehydrogenase/sirohydrochlorin ferrochelatase [Shewanella abyssi]|uniref:precorrin-2 dehydrogenase/sirohydrochlorin ferrochelatase family protein n=1 Tax=Shewanella abyssi TaxID=311789 RepID=UPI00200F2AF3|nr:bifunctional precorrin-2 dehydrogenase/sirohydrochlorin ferrochelatase [Shewanella abyssi]MCL1048321.1 bifunctional precorrin-2 dehydrogenase/sirohydrochlorin ferrochelatase [Shewanella abyssi]
MQYFPLFVDTQSLKVLVVGAGDVASRKLDLLCRTEAEVHVIALEISAEVTAYQQQGRITLEQRPVRELDIESWDLVYLATADKLLNETLATVAKQRNIWVNVVDNPSFCRFITPSIVDRGRLQIAISTAGAAPVYARELRARLESWLPQSITPLFDFIAERRQDVQVKLPIFKERRLFWQRFFKLNQSRFDEQTMSHYQASFSQQDGQGELLLLDITIDAELLPIAAMPYLQKLDIVFSKQSMPHSLNELLRRDAARDSNWSDSSLKQALKEGAHCLVCADVDEIMRLATLFPQAKRFKLGAI